MTTTAPRRPVPQVPGPQPTPVMVSQLRLAAQLREVTDALDHRTARSSQALPTALLEVTDAARAVRVLCPMTDVRLTPEEKIRADAARLRLDSATIQAAALGATASEIDSATKGALQWPAP